MPLAATAPFNPVPDGPMKREYIVHELTAIQTEIQMLQHCVSHLEKENDALCQQNQLLCSEMHKNQTLLQHDLQQVKNFTMPKGLKEEGGSDGSDGNDESVDEEVKMAQEKAEKSKEACGILIIKVQILHWA
jgi:hypothetical protein